VPRVRALRLLLALVLALVAPAAAGAADGTSRGRGLFFSGCAECHGADLTGVQADPSRRGADGKVPAGPPLLGVGELAADFYLRTGYMPLDDPEEQPRRSKPSYSERDLRALVRFVASFGGPRTPQVDLARGRTSAGLKLFVENCAGCHQVVGAGGYLTGAEAVPLDQATARQIAQAVRIGPYVMPRFSERQISDGELDSLVRYVLYTQDPRDSGGWSLEHLGPVSEGIVAWLVAGAGLLLVARAIGERIR